MVSCLGEAFSVHVCANSLYILIKLQKQDIYIFIYIYMCINAYELIYVCVCTSGHCQCHSPKEWLRTPGLDFPNWGTFPSPSCFGA